MALNTWIGSITNTNPTPSNNNSNGGNTITNVIKGVQNAVNSVNNSIQNLQNNTVNKSAQTNNASVNKSNIQNNLSINDYVVENDNVYRVEKVGAGEVKTLVNSSQDEINKYNQVIEQYKLDNNIIDRTSLTDLNPDKTINEGYITLNKSESGGYVKGQLGKKGTYQIVDDDEGYTQVAKNLVKIQYTNDNPNANSLKKNIEKTNSEVIKPLKQSIKDYEEIKNFANGRDYYISYINFNGTKEEFDYLGDKNTYLIQNIDDNTKQALGLQKNVVKLIVTKDNPHALEISQLGEENASKIQERAYNLYDYTSKNVADVEFTFGEEREKAEKKYSDYINNNIININGTQISRYSLDEFLGIDTQKDIDTHYSTNSIERQSDLLHYTLTGDKAGKSEGYYDLAKLDALDTALTAVGVAGTVIPVGGLGIKAGTTFTKHLTKSIAGKELSKYVKNQALKKQIEELGTKEGKEYIQSLYNINKLEKSLGNSKSILSDMGYASKESIKEFTSKLTSNPSKKIGSITSFVGITGLNKMGDDGNSVNDDLTNAISYIGSVKGNPFSKIGSGIITGALSIPQFGINIFKGTKKTLSGGIFELPSASVSGTKELISHAVSDPYSFYGEMIGIGTPIRKVSSAIKKPALKGENLILGNIQASRIGKVTEQITKKVKEDYEYALTHGKEEGGNPEAFTRIEKYTKITPKEAGKRRKDIYWETWKAVDSTKNVDIAPAMHDSLGFSELTISKKLDPKTVDYVEKLTAYSNPIFYGTGSGVKFSELADKFSYGDMARLSDDIDSAVKTQSKAITDTSLTIINDFINTKGNTKLKKDPEGVGTLYEEGHYKDTHIVGDNYGDVEQTAVLGDVYGQISKTPTYIYSPNHNIFDFSSKNLIGKVFSETPHSDYRRKTEGALGLKSTNEKHLFRKEEITSSTIGYGKENLTDNVSKENKNKKEAIVQAELQNWKNPANWLLYPISYISDIGAKINNIIPRAKEAVYHGTYKMEKQDQKMLQNALETVDLLGLDKTKIPNYKLINDLAYESNVKRVWKSEPLLDKTKRLVVEVGKFKGNSPLTSQLTIRGTSKDAHRAKDSLDLALESAKRGIFDTHISKHFTKEQRENYVKAFNSMFKEPMFIDEIHQGFIDKMGTINPQYALLLVRKKAISHEEYVKNKKLYDKEIGLRKERNEKVNEEEPALDYEGMSDKEMKDMLKEKIEKQGETVSEKSPNSKENKSISENTIDYISTGAIMGTSATAQNQTKEMKELRKQMVLEEYYRNINNKPIEQVNEINYENAVKNAQISSMMRGISQSAFNSLGSVVRVEKSAQSSKSKLNDFDNVFGFKYENESSPSGKNKYSQSNVLYPSFSKYKQSQSSKSSKPSSIPSDYGIKSNPSSPYGGSKPSSPSSPYGGSKPSSPSSPYSPYKNYKPSSPYSPYSPKSKSSASNEYNRKKSRKSTEKFAIMTHTVKNPLSVMGYAGFVDIEQYKEAKGKRVKQNGRIIEDFGKMPKQMGGMFGIQTPTRALTPAREGGKSKNKGKAKPSKKSNKMFGDIQW